MRIFMLVLGSLLATATPVLADEGVHFRGSVMAMPLPSSLLGAGLEVADDGHRLGAIAEVGLPLQGPTRVWAAWLRWLPWEAGDHAFGLLVGYNQSYALFPYPDLPPVPGGPNSRWELPGALVGVTYQWTASNWWLRVSPHVGVGYSQYWRFDPTFRSLLIGPPLAEVAWQPVDHLEVGLRLSITPLRVGLRY